MQKFYIAVFIFLYSSLIFAQNDTLQNDLINLKEVIVTATRAQKNLKNVPITVQVVTAEDIRKSQATNFQSFLETEFAGINFTYDGGMPNISVLPTWKRTAPCPAWSDRSCGLSSPRAPTSSSAEPPGAEKRPC